MRYLFGDYTLDISRWELRRMGTLIRLRPKVFDVLVYLIAHRDRVISRQEIFDHLWPRQFVGDTTLNSCIREARQAIGDTGQAQRLIQTLHSRGYRFIGTVGEANDPLPVEATHALLALPLASAESTVASSTAAHTTSAPEERGQAVAPTPVLRGEAQAWVEGGGTGHDALEGERKPVTILCCAVANARRLAAHLGPEAMYRLMRAFVALAQDVVQRYGGTLTQQLSDGFVAFFGAPVAQEDHARRAVLAALEVQQRAREQHALRTPLRGACISTSMGLHSGVVIVGPLGEEAHALYAALDDTTDMVGRLQQLAGPDTILMSEATRRLVEEEVRVEPSTALDMRDLPQPLAIYEVLEVTGRRSGVTGRRGRSLSPFVGRTHELAALQALLAQAEAGQGQVVGIIGEPGIGKSRLLYEFAWGLRDTGAKYLEIHCFAYDQKTPYGPVLGLLRQLCGMADADGPEAMATKLCHCLREAGLTLDADAAYLLPLLGLPEGTAPLVDLNPEARKARTLAILRHLSLHSLQGRPRIIVVENVHWIDPSSEEYFALLADSLLLERRRALHAGIVDAIEGLNAEHLTDQIERLAHHARRGEVWDKALRYCRQAGEKATERSACREAAEYFEEALSALAHLPETHATREQAIDLRLALYAVLMALGNAGRLWVCLHEADSLAATLDDQRRLRQVALFLPNQFYRMGAYGQAVTAAQRALALAMVSGEVGLRAQANYYLGTASEAQGNYRRAIDCFKETVASLEGTPLHERFGLPNLPSVQSRAHLAVCYAELGLFAEGSAVGEEGLRIAEAVAHPGSQMRAYYGLGLLALRQGDLPRALPWLEQALGIFQDMDLPAWTHLMAAALGAAYTLSGRIADAMPLLTRALEQATTTAMVSHQALHRLSLGEAQLLAGQLQEARALAEGALALAEEHQERGHQAYALRLLGDIAARCDPQEGGPAEDHYRQALALAGELGMRPLQAHCHRGLGMLYATIGRRAEARAELATAIALYRAMEMTFWLPQAAASLAQLQEG